MTKKKGTLNYDRLVFQWFIVLLLAYMVVRLFLDKTYKPDFETYCPFGGMQALGSYFSSGSLACSMTSVQIVFGIILLAGVILFSKLFCGYLCPVGIFTEWSGKLGDKIKSRFTITGLADRILRILKYGLLFITFYYTIKTSELFCKQYDPYYAIFTWFGSDVNLIFAVIAIVITVLGAIFLRQFWCKYLCPLSAISNIFSFLIISVIIFALYVILLLIGLPLSWVYLLAALCIISYLQEATRLKFNYFPLFYITRHEETCIDCNICTKACPQAIDVAKVKWSVKHIDCNLCCDCIAKCPETGALKINKRRLYRLPATVILVFIAAGLFIGSTFELPTVNIRWGSDDELKTAAVYKQSGIKNIKCFGSSMSFVEQMKKVKGVLGVETFAGSHSVKIFYNPEILNNDKLKNAIFTPVKYLIYSPDSSVITVKFTRIGIDRFFDKYDSFYLTN
jgi:polyferredoxin